MHKISLLALSVAVSAIEGQQLPPLRQLGEVTGVSPAVLQSVFAVRPLPGGRVLVNDIRGHRLLLFDSTLTQLTVVLDSVGGAAHSYGSLAGGLIAFHGDSTVFVDRSSLSMLVIDPNGKIARIEAAPTADDAMYLIGGPQGTPALDATGRLVYRGAARRLPTPGDADVGTVQTIQLYPDSAPLIRFDFRTRHLDTLTFLRVPVQRMNMVRNRNGSSSSMMVLDPFPTIDDWAVTPDGSVAVLRGKDYHLDWLDGGGKSHALPKTPYAWERLTDEDKIRVADSAKSDVARQMMASSPSAELPPLTTTLPDQLPDYRPPFKPGAMKVDLGGNFWIRTTHQMGPSAIYDVVNSRGELVRRVVVPPFRVITGFGPGGAVYMAVVDSLAVPPGVRLERARMP
jgi:hypothetical protein